MDWARHLQVSENGSYRLTLYRQNGQNFSCLSDAPDALPADAGIVACVRLSGMNAFVCDCHPPLNRAVCMRDAFPLKRCLDALAREAPRTRAYADEALSLTAGLALIEFLRCVEDEALPLPSKAQRAAAAVQHMLNEYRHPWRVEELSAQAGVSSSYLTKFCRREYGKSPMALLLGTAAKAGRNRRQCVRGRRIFRCILFFPPVSPEARQAAARFSFKTRTVRSRRMPNHTVRGLIFPRRSFPPRCPCRLE